MNNTTTDDKQGQPLLGLGSSEGLGVNVRTI